MNDQILGASCIATGAYLAWTAVDYSILAAVEPVGPGTFPALLGGLLVGGGLWLVLRPCPLPPPGAQAPPWPPVAATMSAVLAYALLFEWLGFVLATALMALAVGLAFSGPWKRVLAGGAVLAGLLYLLFDRLLDLRLPPGLLSLVLTGPGG